MQDCIFSNLGLFRNMKPTDVSWYSISGKTYGLRNVDEQTRNILVMSLCLIKDMSQFHVFFNQIKKKILSKKNSFSTFLENQFSIFNENNLTMDHLTIWRRRKNFDLLQLIVFDIITNLLAFSYFSTYSEMWSPPNFPLFPNWLLILLFLWMDIPFGSFSKFTAD